MARYYIGFDCGTMGTKTAIYREDSTRMAEAYRENKISYPHPGWAEMDPCGFVRAVREGVRECLCKSGVNPREIRAISASGIICGIVGIDKDWNPVTPFVPYLDNRARCEAEWVKRNVKPVWEEESGNITVDEFMPPIILRWFFKHYTGFKEKAAKVLNNGPFVLGTLAGLKADEAFLDWATMSGWLIGYNVHDRQWSKRQMDALEIPMDILPRIVKPWDVVGYLCPEEAEQMGAQNILGRAYLGLGELYQNWGKMDVAQDYLAKAAAVFERTRAERFLAKSKELLNLPPDDEVSTSVGKRGVCGN